MKMHKKERQAIAQFLADYESAQESEYRATTARERLVERTYAEPERVLDWLSRLRPGREDKNSLLQMLRRIATIRVLEKYLGLSPSVLEGKGQ